MIIDKTYVTDIFIACYIFNKYFPLKNYTTVARQTEPPNWCFSSRLNLWLIFLSIIIFLHLICNCNTHFIWRFSTFSTLLEIICYFVSGVLRWACFVQENKTALEMVVITIRLLQILLRSWNSTAFLCNCEQIWNPFHPQLSFTLVIIENRKHEAI